jgi:GNAT superfamily N-acetyltransferase
VRAARAEDYPRWKPLWDGYNAFYGRLDGTALAPEITALTWSRFLDPAEPMHALLAEAGDVILGLTHFLYHRSTIYSNPICYLSDLYTLEAARGRGVGAALIQAVDEHARGAGAARVYWLTHETNAVARGLYDKLAERSGFIVYRQSI